MQIEKNSDYKELKKRHAPPSPMLGNAVRAFFVGGAVCALGQILFYLYGAAGAGEEDAYILVTLSLIFLSALFTAFGFFDSIARFGGAGTLLPVTGFANSITASAIDAKSEGLIGGVGTKIFSLAGPVILYTTFSGTLYGIVYYIFTMFGGR